MKNKLFAYILTLALIFTAVLGNGLVVNAGGDEEDWGDDTTKQAITTFEPKVPFDEEGIYPASLKYAIRGLGINITFESGKMINTYAWEYSEWQKCYMTYGSNGYETFLMRFYDANGEEVNITDNYVPIGDFTAKVYRNQDTSAIWEDTVKILAPTAVTENVSGNSVTFSSAVNKRFEEKWYPVSAGLSGNYIYTKSLDINSQYPSFVGIWNYENGVATRVNEGVYYYMNNTFTHEYTQTANTYLVVGETEKNYNITSNVEWQAEKDVTSISISTEASYKVWNRDFYDIPLTVTYEDGTSEKYDGWKYTSSLPDANGDGEWVYEDGLELTTKNGDKFYLTLRDENDELVPFTYNEWKPGEYRCVAYLDGNREMEAKAAFIVDRYKATTLDITKFIPNEFTVTPSQELYYTFTTGNESVKMEVYNATSNSMQYNLYYREPGVGAMWKASRSSSVRGSDTHTLSANTEYLYIIETDKTASGTIGVYVNATTKSATVNVDKVDSADLKAWASLPVTLQFVADDGETEVGKQTVSVWSTSYSYSGCGVFRTKYNETILYALYDGDTKVNVPILSEEVLAYIEELGETDPEVLEAILAEMGIDATPVEPGTYTVKVFKGSLSDSNLIGSKTIEVIDSGDVPECKNHEWSNWTTVKKATCKESGLKERTCKVCGAKEEDTIAKLTTHSYDAGKVIKEATCTAKGTLQKTCTICGTTKNESIATIPHETVKAKKASFGVEGTSAGIHCSMCGKSEVKVVKAVKEPTLSFAVTTYDGKVKKPTVTVKDAGNKALSTSDYSVTYETGRKNPGEYNVTITLKNNYEGTKVLTFAIQPKAPTNVKANLAAKDAIKLTWKAATGASSYEVAYKEKGEKTYTYSGRTTKREYTVRGLKAGTAYEFTVTPCYKGKKTIQLSKLYAKVSTTTLSKVTGVSVVKSSSTKVKVSWKNVANESGYIISYTDAKGKGSTVRVATTSGKSKTITVPQNKALNFKVKAYKTVNGKRVEGEWSDSVAFTLRNVKSAKNVKASLYKEYNDVRVTWTAASGANAYNVSVKKGTGKYGKVVLVTDTKYIAENLSDGAKYTFKIQPCYVEKGKVVATGTVSTASINTLKKVVSLKVKKASSKVNVTWGKVTGVSGYQIVQATDVNFTTSVKTTNYGTTSGTSKKLTANKGVAYYYRVRAYKTVGTEKIYGPWSNTIVFTRK